MAVYLGNTRLGATMSPSDRPGWLDDGDTHVWYSIPDDEADCISEAGSIVKYDIAYTSTSPVSVDWGDGSEIETFAASPTAAKQLAVTHNFKRTGLIRVDIKGATKISSWTWMFCSQNGSNIPIYRSTRWLHAIELAHLYNHKTTSTSEGPYIGRCAKWLKWIKFFDSHATVVPSYMLDICNRLEELEIPEGVTRLNSEPFGQCYNLKRLKLPSTLTEFYAAWQFYNCYSLEELELPNGFTTFGPGASFVGCIKLKKIYIPDSVTSLGTGDSTFSGCYSATEIRLSPNCPIIPKAAFSNCFNVREIIIPEGVTTIGQQAFSSCWNCQKIVIPSTCTSIGLEAFNNRAIRPDPVMVTINATTPPEIPSQFIFTFNNSTLALMSTGSKIYVPTGCGDTYKSHQYWGLLSDYIEEVS